MTDIVRRLRGTDVSFTDSHYTELLNGLHDDAANEIVRLRRHNAKWDNLSTPRKILVSALSFCVGVVGVLGCTAFVVAIAAELLL